MAPPIVIGGAAGLADFVAARIRRANPSIDKEAARELAAELHDIVASARERCSAAEESDLIQTMMREIVDDRPPGDAEAHGFLRDKDVRLKHPGIRPRDGDTCRLERHASHARS